MTKALTYDDLIDVFAKKIREACKTKSDFIMLLAMNLGESEALYKRPFYVMRHPWVLVLANAKVEAFEKVKHYYI